MSTTSGSKTLFIDDLPMPELVLDVEFSYSYDPGKYNGLPENCYSEEEESEIVLPADYEQRIFDHYLRAAREAIKHVVAHVEGLRSEVAAWAEEENRSATEDRAVANYELRGM